MNSSEHIFRLWSSIESFLERVGELEGRAIVSYGELPSGAEKFWSVTREGEKQFIDNGKTGEAKEATERLLFNFEPDAGVE